jgi:hypothetical protein
VRLSPGLRAGAVADPGRRSSHDKLSPRSREAAAIAELEALSAEARSEIFPVASTPASQQSLHEVTEGQKYFGR